MAHLLRRIALPQLLVVEKLFYQAYYLLAVGIEVAARGLEVVQLVREHGHGVLIRLLAVEAEAVGGGLFGEIADVYLLVFCHEWLWFCVFCRSFVKASSVPRLCFVKASSSLRPTAARETAW